MPRPSPLPSRLDSQVKDAPDSQTDLDGAEHDAAVSLHHRFSHNRSILALAFTSSHVFAGTQGGEILAFNLQTCQKVASIEAHHGSVLSLCLSSDERLLFSGAGDRFVNVWDTKTLTHQASIYSLYDVGDIFCVSYAVSLQTVYLGCQNTSIQWYDLRGFADRPAPDPASHPSQRKDRFFDSAGPGGIYTPKASDDRVQLTSHVGRILEIDQDHIHQFAHHGYVLCSLMVQGSTIGLDEGEVLVSGGGDGLIQLWRLDAEDGGRIQLYATLGESREDPEPVLCFNLEGSFLFVGRAGGEIDAWDLEIRQLIRTVKINDLDILSVAVGRGMLFGADSSGYIQKYNHRYEHLRTWRGHQGRVLASSFRVYKGRPLLLTGSSDDTLAIWDMSDCVSPQQPHFATNEEDLVNALRKFVSFRTVSSDPRCKVDCHRGASFLRSVLKRFGATTEMLRTSESSNPVVYAHFACNKPGRRKRRTLFYGHYDVVAADDKNKQWVCDPFSLSGMDGFLYGRGSSDNKGPTLAAIYAVADLVASKSLPADVIFLIEGEEEHGSLGFRDTVKRYKDMIGPIDWILLANSYWIDDQTPCLTYGLRGVIHGTVSVWSNEPDLHSGVDGSVHLSEPLKDLVMLVGSLSGRNGHVNIPGFYDAIPPISADELALYDEISKPIVDRDPSLGPVSSLNDSFIGRWRNPNLTIHGFKTSGSEKSTIIPHEARVTISLRIVPNQDVDTIATSLVSHLQSEFQKLESRNQMRVTINHKSEPWLGDYKSEIFKTLDRAIVDVWNSPTRNASAAAAASVAVPESPNAARHARKVSSFTSPPMAPAPDGALRPLSAAGLQPLATSSTLASSSVKDASLLSPTFPPKESSTSDPDPKIKPNISIAPTVAQASSAAQPPCTPLSPTISIASPMTPIQKPLYIREGGSIPAIRFLEKTFGAPAAHLPCGQASDNAHLDNERIRLVNLINARRVFCRVFGSS